MNPLFKKSLARRTLWLADADFLATSRYVNALCSAALSGVDVRLLSPRAAAEISSLIGEMQALLQ